MMSFDVLTNNTEILPDVRVLADLVSAAFDSGADVGAIAELFGRRYGTDVWYSDDKPMAVNDNLEPVLAFDAVPYAQAWALLMAAATNLPYGVRFPKD